MNRIFVCSFLALTLLASACGKNNNIQATDEPEFAVSPEFIQLQPPDDIRPAAQTGIRLENNGDGKLTILKLEWIEKSDRLVALGERGGSCTSDDECDSGQICMVQSKTCVTTGLPPVPFDVQLSNELNFAVTKGGPELGCPEPGPSVPSEFFEGYCGALRVETNAINDAEGVENGAATIYFLTYGGSGEIVVQPTFMEFVQVQPGTIHEQQFSIRNDGMEDLTVRNITVEDNPDFFTITGETVAVGGVISPGTAADFNVRLEIPADATDYETNTEIVVDSSAGVERIRVEVTAEAGASPFIEVSDDVLEFSDAATRTLTIQNTGDGTLRLYDVEVNPEIRDFYRFELDGNDITNDFGDAVSVTKGTSIELDVIFERPSDNMEPAVGSLRISHNDPNHGQRTEVTLLGDAGDVPFATIHPSSFTFLASDGNAEERTFVIRNIGTAALDLTNVTWMFSTGSDAEFSVTGVSGSVPPGGIKEASVSFTGINAMQDVGLAIFETNNPIELSMSLRALPSTQAAPGAVITVENQGALRVAAPVNLNATMSTPAGSAGNAIWTLLSRPSGSSVFLDGVGEDASFVPDVAGTYTVALTLLATDRESQTTLDLTVE